MLTLHRAASFASPVGQLSSNVRPQMDAPLLLTPLQEMQCAVCGMPNECSAALTGTFNEPCWCASMQISSNVLVLVLESKRGKACVCKACATKEI